MGSLGMKINIKEAIENHNIAKKLSGSDKMNLSKLAESIEYESRNPSTLRSDFSQFINGTRNCPIIILKQICLILNVSADVILEIL